MNLKVPFALLLFVFMCNLGLMFWTIRNPEHYVLFVLSIALCVALPHVPTQRA